MASEGILANLALEIMPHYFFHILLVRNESQATQLQRQAGNHTGACIHSEGMVYCDREKENEEGGAITMYNIFS